MSSSSTDSQPSHIEKLVSTESSIENNKDQIFDSLNDLCWKYFHNEIAYNEIKSAIKSKCVLMTIYSIIDIQSPHYDSVYVYFMNNNNKAAVESLDLTDSDNLELLLSILERKVYVRLNNRKYIVGFDVLSYHIGYRLKYSQNYGYEELYKQFYPDKYEEDVIYWIKQSSDLGISFH